MILRDYGAPTRRWFRLQEMTKRINPTKQGYCLIKVPATGVFWSTVWSTKAWGASAWVYLGLPYMSLTCDWVIKTIKLAIQMMPGDEAD